MKSAKKKERFILMRAEGQPYSAIALELGISKSTCTAWEKELKQSIADQKADALRYLYHSYYMTKEARIKRLGAALQDIEKAMEKIDLSSMPPEKLLEWRLKYLDALKAEWIPVDDRLTYPEDKFDADMALREKKPTTDPYEPLLQKIGIN